MNRKLLLYLCLLLVVVPLQAWSQEGVFLTEEQAPKAVFPDATSFERKVTPSTAELKEKIKERMGKAKTSLWEPYYLTFVAGKEQEILGHAVIVEEIGKHRPITFVVGVERNGRVRDAAIMVYREAYGGEVRDRRFLAQYRGKDIQAPLLPFRDIRNITGATLSAEAIGRGIKKALALVQILYPTGGQK